MYKKILALGVSVYYIAFVKKLTEYFTFNIPFQNPLRKRSHHSVLKINVFSLIS